MMSRRNTFPSLSSSRQMMMAWKVSGLSHRPAIIASRPASIRLAMAISPSRERSSTEPISRRYMRTGSSVRSVGSLASDLAGTFCWTSTNSPLSPSPSSSASSRGLFARLLGLYHVHAHLAEHGQHILDLLGIDLLGGQHRVDLVMGHVAALLGGANELFNCSVGEVEQRAVRRALGCLFLRQVFLLRRRFNIAYHKPPQPALTSTRSRCCRVADSLKGWLGLPKTSAVEECFRFPTQLRRKSLTSTGKFTPAQQQ